MIRNIADVEDERNFNPYSSNLSQLCSIFHDPDNIDATVLISLCRTT